MLNNIISQSFEGITIRFVGDKPVANDVAAALGYADRLSPLGDPAVAISKKVNTDNKAVSIMETPGGNQQVMLLEEAGIYQLIFQSKLPNAKKFQDWVFKDVLPSIRTRGTYSLTTSTIPSTPAEILLQNVQLLVAQERKLACLEANIEAQGNLLTKVDERTEQFEIPSGYQTVNSYLATLNTCTVSSGNGRATTRLGMYLARNGYTKYPTKVWDKKAGREVNAYEEGACEDALRNLIEEGTFVCYLPYLGKVQIRVHNEQGLPAKRKATYTASQAIAVVFA